MRLYPEASNLYIAESGSIKTPISAQTYGKTMRHCQAQFPGRDVADFTTQDLATYCLLAPKGKPAPAGKTVSKRMGHLRGSFRWFKWRGLCDPDPAADLPFVVRPSKNGVRHHTWLKDDQVSELYRSYDEADIFQRRDRLILMLGLFTGLRLDALANLAWDQFSDDYSTLRVMVKGNKPLELPIMDQLGDELREWRKLGWFGATAVIPSVKEQYDWTSNARRKVLVWDKPLGNAGIYTVVKRAGRSLGVHLAPHDMRRSYLGWLDDQGMDIRLISALAGHENIATTAGYLEQNPARLRRATLGLRRDL